jgi:YHS domain-containing protein
MSMRRAFLCGFMAVAAGGAAGATRALAQAGAPQAERLGLRGYDPVAYFTASAATPGLPEFEYIWDGVRYRFASARNRDLFKANPEKYAPQFGGLCAMNMATGVRREADPTIWIIADGTLYVFASTTGSERFRFETKANATRAYTNWQTLKNAPTQ